MPLPASATNLVTGNGFGFAVVSPETGAITKFYDHPYSFTRPDPNSPLSEGIETTNFIKNISFGDLSARSASAEYEDDSHIIQVRSSAGEGYVFMPFGLRRPALIFTWDPTPGAASKTSFNVQWSHPVSVDSKLPGMAFATQYLAFNGVSESLLLISFGAPGSLSSANGSHGIGGQAWALISLDSRNEVEQAERDFSRWHAGFSPRALVRRELSELERWRVTPTVQFTSEKERHLWRQSEVMLRMAQSREPNRADRYGNGLIVASLPDGVWFTPWVRDMAWATVALIRMGHRGEARAALLAYFNARPTGKMRVQVNNADYQISVVRYWGDGGEEPFFTEEGSTNIEFDDWGEALWVLGEYLRKYNDPSLLATRTYRGSLYQGARDYIVKPLLANLEPYAGGEIVAADTSIWEERQKDKKHFAFSTAMAIVGLRSFAYAARRAGDESACILALYHANLLQIGFQAAFIRDGHLHGTLEEGVKNDIDGALLAIIHFGVVTDPAIIRDAVERMELLKVASGGYRRVRSTYTDPKIFEYWYERQEFLFVDISLAEVLRSMNRASEAAAMEKRIVNKAAADHNIIPEMYVAVPCDLFPGNIGDPTGARPMAGYGAGAYILDVLDQSRLQ